MSQTEQYDWLAAPQSESDVMTRAYEDTEAYNAALKDEAEALGTTQGALKLYADALKNANQLTKDNSLNTAEMAAASYKFNKAFNQSRKTYDSNKDAVKAYAKAMQKGEEVSYDVADATDEVLEELKGMGIVLTSDDFKNPKTVENLNKLLSGTKEEAEAAYKALEKTSTVNTMMDAFSGTELNTEKYKTQIEGFANYLSTLKFDNNGMAELDEK